MIAFSSLNPIEGLQVTKNKTQTITSKPKKIEHNIP